MYYKLKVTKFEDNPSYESAVEKWREDMKIFNSPYGMRDNPGPEPEKLLPTSMLEVVVNEEQYKAVQKAVLEQFK